MARKSEITAREPYRVLHSVWGLATGGVGKVVLNNVRYLNPARFSGTVVYLVPRDDLLGEYRDAGVEPICLEHRDRSNGMRTLMRAVRLIRDRRIDLVHTNHSLDKFYLSIAASLNRVPVVSTLHNTTPPRRLLRGRLALAFSRTPVAELINRRLTHHYVAVSKAVRDAQVAGRKIPEQSVTVIHSGVEPHPFIRMMDPAAKEDLRRKLGIEGRNPVILNVGRLHEQKGQRYLVPMMAEVSQRYPNAILLIVGEGKERAVLEGLIRDTNIKDSIRLLGVRFDIPELLSLTDVFVFPSVHKEGLGLAVVEAALAGLPIVSARTAPLEEVIEDGRTGFLVPPREPAQMAAAVLRVLYDQELARRTGETARAEAIRKFSIAESVAKLEKVYFRVLKESSNS